ncbi:YHS domain-containing (seleno)protein [Shimia aestuarii]|uniref:YHS domain-containing (seleno)protein n=1 Tax=Shimia aestuarii TaxID=254406 RepID=UPI001FB54A52|nr:YHS domain-containing (seleno)protein [Shimia aestuarii]
MNALKTLISGTALSLALATSALALGVELNTSTTGLALQGYDPVAYFLDSAAEKGSYKITSVHNGATYRFANKEHKEAFDANPDAYLPQYGGYCAFGTAMGFKFDGDPTQWKIVDGELFLNLSSEIHEKWQGDQANFITKADDNWPEIEDKAPTDLQN